MVWFLHVLHANRTSSQYVPGIDGLVAGGRWPGPGGPFEHDRVAKRERCRGPMDCSRGMGKRCVFGLPRGTLERTREAELFVFRPIAVRVRGSERSRGASVLLDR